MNEILTLSKEIGEKLPIEEQPATTFVCLMGIATVFAGLICLIILCKIIGALVGKEKKPAALVPTPAANQPIENRQEIIAAVSAAVAEELGTDISALRILSFKKI